MQHFLVILLCIVSLSPMANTFLSNRCSRVGTCKLLQDCLPALNELKLHGTPPTRYCDSDQEVVCCEEQNLRISEKSTV